MLEAWKGGAVVVVASAVEGSDAVVAAGTPRVPVHCAPCGQQATARLESAVQIAVRGQQSPGALRAAQA
jgi:hypothetical protein